jgi:hypothetical protein
MKTALHRRRGGLEQQGQRHHEKSVWAFGTYRFLERALYLSLGKLPEPEVTTISSEQAQRQICWQSQTPRLFEGWEPCPYA